jgi:hypothetical protein
MWSVKVLADEIYDRLGSEVLHSVVARGDPVKYFNGMLVVSYTVIHFVNQQIGLACRVLGSCGCADAAKTDHITNITHESKFWSEQLYDGMVLLG